MRILSLNLRGAIGIRKGLGKEEVFVDLKDFEPGLIALSGKNGAGKTTIMEMLQPYRCMVSRTGAIENHFELKDSHKILDFMQNGIHYRSILQIDAFTGASKAYLQIVEGEKITSLNDGLKKSYDEALERILGSQELFFNSVFSGQKSKGVASLKPGERKKLFFELLNLLKYANYTEASKKKLNAAEMDLAELEGQMSALKSNRKDPEAIKLVRDGLISGRDNSQKALNENKANISKTEEEIKKLEIEIVKLQEKEKSDAVIKEKITELEEKLETNLSKYETARSEIIAEQNKTEAEIEANTLLVKEKEKIETSVKRMKELEGEINLLLVEFNNLNSKQNMLNFAKSEGIESLAEDKEKIDKLDKLRDSSAIDLAALEKEIEEIHNNASLINDVPCTEVDGDFSGCQFLVKAYEAKNSLPELQNEQKKLEDLIKIQTAELKGLEESYSEKLAKINSDFESMTKEVNEKKEKISEKKKRLNSELGALKLTDWNEKYEALQKAETQLEILRERLSNTEKSIKTLQDQHLHTSTEISNELNHLKGQLNIFIREEISALEEDIIKFQYKLSNYNKEKEEIESELESFKNGIISADNSLIEIEANEKEIKKLEKEMTPIVEDIKDWTFLIKAFDKTGIPILKLENSGVKITNITNELLEMFETKFRIVFETTKLSADKKKMIETFNINIVEEDGVTEISNKSGGQQVWIETAIQSAISLVVRQQGLNIETSFLDEADGALDIANAFAYIEMIRKAHLLSGVHNTFIITHRPELLEFIPQQIVLADGMIGLRN